MKITYGQINTALEQFDRLNLRSASSRLMEAIAHNSCALEEAQQRFQKERELLQRKHIATDEDGNMVAGDQPNRFQIEDEAAFNEAYQDLLGREHEVEIMQVPAEEIAAAGFSGRVLGRLHFMVDFGGGDDDLSEDVSRNGRRTKEGVA